MVHLLHGTALPLSIPVAIGLAAPAAAQFGNEWVEFVHNPGSLAGAPSSISNGNNEVDFVSGDLDRDGDDDLVIVRKEPFTTSGKRTNILAMSENGVLVNRTLEYASASDVPGDNGFLSPTNDRDVILTDVDGDDWLDVVTATTRSSGETKAVGHPRIYMNLGEDGGGNWLGLRYEEARIPQLFLFGNGLPKNPDFCGVSAGDVTGSGLPDLYFIDYDSMEDRLLVNDGNGYFTDQTTARMTAEMYTSAFGTSTSLEDFNGDGTVDVLKNTNLSDPIFVGVLYNNPSNEGFFNIKQELSTSTSAYHVSSGDLNKDGRIDLILSDDNLDRFHYNTGNDQFGRVVWGPPMTYQFLTGGDDGLGGSNMIVDLNNDGWSEAIICDVDVDIPGYDRRIHIYHNPGGAVGQQIQLREERQNSSGSSWLGAVGLHESDLQGGYDTAAFDLDGDGDNDLVLGRGSGTDVWINQTVPNQLFTDTATVSLASGGTQQLHLRAGSEHAGEFYWVLGSASGTSGYPAGAFSLPLTFDWWTQHTLSNPNTALLGNTLGFLDASGEAFAIFDLPAGVSPSFAETTLFHAFATVDVLGSGQVTSVSNPMTVMLTL